MGSYHVKLALFLFMALLSADDMTLKTVKTSSYMYTTVTYRTYTCTCRHVDYVYAARCRLMQLDVTCNYYQCDRNGRHVFKI